MVLLIFAVASTVGWCTGRGMPKDSQNTFKAYLPWLGTEGPRAFRVSNHSVIVRRASSPIYGSGGSCLFANVTYSNIRAEYFRWGDSVRQRSDSARNTKSRIIEGEKAAELQHRKRCDDSENMDATEKGSARASVAETRGLGRFGAGSRPRDSPVKMSRRM